MSSNLYISLRECNFCAHFQNGGFSPGGRIANGKTFNYKTGLLHNTADPKLAADTVRYFTVNITTFALSSAWERPKGMYSPFT